MVHFRVWYWLVLVVVVAILFRDKSRIYRLLDDLADSIRSFKERLNVPNNAPGTDNEFEAYSRAWLIVLAALLVIIAIIYMANKSWP